MRCKYLPQDLEARLGGGVAFYDKEPVRVSIEGGKIRLYSFPEMAPLRYIVESDELFDISAPRLGYVNYEREAIYVTRQPERRYKQTLTFGPLRFTPSPEIYGGDLFESKHFRKMLMNDYPSLNEAMTMLSSKYGSVAITRDLAIKRNQSTGRLHLCIKGKTVGKLSPDTRTFEIKKGFDPLVVDKFIMPYWRS